MPRNYRKKPSRRRKKNPVSDAPVPWYKVKRCMSAADAYSYSKTAFKYLSGLVNSERMSATYTISAQDLSSDNPYSLHLTALANGDASNNRTGLSVFARALNLKLTLTQTNNVRSFVRIMIVRDKQQIGDTAPALTDILDQATPTSLLATIHKGRFDIMYNQVVALDGTGSGSAMRMLNINKVMRSHIRFNGTAATDIQKNGLYLYAFSDQTDASGTEPQLDGQVRLYYHDN